MPATPPPTLAEVEEFARMLAGAATLNAAAPPWRQLDETDQEAYRDEARALLGKEQQR